MGLFDDETLASSIRELKILDNGVLVQALSSCKQSHQSLQEYLIKKDILSDENLGQIIADLIHVPFIRLSQEAISDDVLHGIPEIVAKKQHIIAFKKNKNGISLAMANPKDIEMIEFVRKKTGVPVQVYYATPRDIDNAITRYSQNIGAAFDTLIASSVDQVKGIAKDPQIVKIVNMIIEYADTNRASDVHIEPMEDHVAVRFRIDGVLHDVITLPSTLDSQIVTRVKVMAELRTDEHQVAQDGKIQYTYESAQDKHALDIRVSIVPITKGEKIVMRLLSERSRQFSLQDLGLAKSSLKKVEQAYTKPYGMILSTGPTGSGKTTTMYALLKLLNQRGVNIMTIEDPVEYDMEGVNQIQVNTKTGLTFASGLRSIVRQDPNIILVGEIRDKETAGIAVNSAMTGHLVLSTLHTNDAATAIPRLIDMSIEPYLIASSVNIIIAQRLVRKICVACRVSRELADRKILLNNFSEKKIHDHFGSTQKIRVYEGKGCPVCHQTGYVGRVGIFEVLEITDKLREAIIALKDAAEIARIAIVEGMSTMVDDGLSKIKQGETTIEEVIRVTKEL